MTSGSFVALNRKARTHLACAPVRRARGRRNLEHAGEDRTAGLQSVLHHHIRGTREHQS